MRSEDSLEIPGKRMRPFDIRDFILRRSLLILFAGLGVFLLLSPVAFLLRKPIYHAGGTILVSPEVPLVAPRDVRRVHGSFREFAMTHAQRIRSQNVARRALDSIPSIEWPDSVPREVPVEIAATILSRQLSVDIVGGSQLLSVGLNGSSSDGLAPTVNAIMKGYVAQLEHEQEGDSKRRLEYLDQERGNLLASIKQERSELQKLSAQLKSSSFNEMINPYYDQLIETQTSFLRASTEALARMSELERAKRDEEVIGDQKLDVFAEELVATNEAVYLIDNWTYQQLQELRSNIDGLTADNPDRLDVEERMKAMNDYLASFKEEMHETLLGILEKKQGFELQTDVTKAESAFLAATKYAETLEQEMLAAQKQFAASTETLARADEITTELDVLNARLQFIDQRMSEVQLESKAPVFLAVEQEAVAPASPLGDNFQQMILMIFAGAFGMVGFFAVAFEFLDGRVRAPGDVKAALGAIPLDPIPDASTSPGSAFSRIVAEQPHSPAARALRQNLVRLNEERERRGAKLFLFSGVGHCDGVTGIVSNLADAFSHYAAQVVVVEFTDEGVELPSEAPEGAPTAEVLIRSLLSGLPSDGEWVGKIELHRDSPILRKRSAVAGLLRELRERHDVVLIDAPPLLKSDLTRFIASFSDTVILVSRRGCGQYQHLRQSVELLFRMEVSSLTAVFNASLVQPLDRLLQWKRHLIEEKAPELKRRFTGKLQKAKAGAGASAAGSPPHRESAAPSLHPDTTAPGGTSPAREAGSRSPDDDLILPG